MFNWFLFSFKQNWGDYLLSFLPKKRICVNFSPACETDSWVLKRLKQHFWVFYLKNFSKGIPLTPLGSLCLQYLWDTLPQQKMSLLVLLEICPLLYRNVENPEKLSSYCHITSYHALPSDLWEKTWYRTRHFDFAHVVM